MGHLEELYNRYGLKIWLTEFAVCCTHDQSDVINFAKEIIPKLEAADFVHRYSWFSTRIHQKNLLRSDSNEDWFLDPDINSLFVNETGELSEIGKLYDLL